MDNNIETTIRYLTDSLVTVSAAAGALVEAAEPLPEEQSPCGFDALHSAVSTVILTGADSDVGTLMVGMIAAACMVEDGRFEPHKPPTIDGAFDVFSEWAHADGRSLGDFKHVLELASSMGKMLHDLYVNLIEAAKAQLPQPSSPQFDSRQRYLDDGPMP